jgi:hypothetical protein
MSIRRNRRNGMPSSELSLTLFEIRGAVLHFITHRSESPYCQLPANG